MEQKRYIYEIVNFLLNESSHIRGIAKALGTNHMLILRKIHELSEKNVVDFKQEGKNNVYFLKKTIEAKTHAFMAEHYKLLQTLSKYPQLRKIIEKIQDDERIKLALFFGSYAKGLSKKDSDIDVYIDSKNRNIKKELSLLDLKLNIKIGEYNKDSLLIKEIEKNHVIIKGVEGYYEKTKIFS